MRTILIIAAVVFVFPLKAQELQIKKKEQASFHLEPEAVWDSSTTGNGSELPLEQEDNSEYSFPTELIQSGLLII